MVIETERLCLREMTENDFEALNKVLADSNIMQHYPYTFDEAKVRNWIQRNIDRYRIFGFGLWAVCLKETGEMIGDCGITMQSIHGEMLPEVGYHIRKDQQRKGYASEAARACRDYAFEELKMRLSEKGLFDESHKKPIPKYPGTIGIITSSAGAAVHDMLRIRPSHGYPADNHRNMQSQRRTWDDSGCGCGCRRASTPTGWWHPARSSCRRRGSRGGRSY